VKLKNLVREFLRLGIVINALPNVITNGALIDAVPVMADFNWIVSQVNANASSTSDMNAAIAASAAALNTTINALQTAVTAWTPNLAFGGASTGITYSLQNGRYMKLGNMVEVWGALTLTSKGSASGLASITGLPFAINTNTSALGSLSIPIGNVVLNSVTFVTGSGTASWFVLTPVSLGGTALFFNGNIGGSVGAGLTDANFSNGSTIYFSARYPD
jgi:hypothetical protein